MLYAPARVHRCFLTIASTPRMVLLPTAPSPLLPLPRDVPASLAVPRERAVAQAPPPPGLVAAPGVAAAVPGALGVVPEAADTLDVVYMRGVEGMLDVVYTSGVEGTPHAADAPEPAHDKGCRGWIRATLLAGRSRPSLPVPFVFAHSLRPGHAASAPAFVELHLASAAASWPVHHNQTTCRAPLGHNIGRPVAVYKTRLHVCVL
mmetsp:Transcript_106811/g.268482  ORF Transcript_106811/g.268482 Transcript_106811/m.268482 type:complete len:205 (-) Transcript_106811:1353-1967(-)